jgi:NAD(P)-dependent dehydrogenase (short-subunit alcohol dehydrogenase family)
MSGMIDVAAPAELFSLAQKVVVITGASSGLGARWAPVVAAGGAEVVLAARREPELATVAAAIPGSLAVTADLTLGQDRQRLVEETLRRHGKIDVLVNNAAAAASSPAADTSLEEFREMIDADLTSQFALTQLAGAAMVALAVARSSMSPRWRPSGAWTATRWRPTVRPKLASLR